MKTLCMQPSALQPSSSRVRMPRAAACPSWRFRPTTGAFQAFETSVFGGFGFIGTGNDLGTGVLAISTTGANHRTHKPYHQRPKENHL